MNLVSVKTASEIALAGVKVVLTMEDKNIVGINLLDREGRLVVVKAAGNYSTSIKVMIPAPPEKATRYVVTGKLLGLAPINEPFENRSDATERLREYRNSTGKYNDDELGLSIEEREVEVDGAQKPVTDLAEIPF